MNTGIGWSLLIIASMILSAPLHPNTMAIATEHGPTDDMLNATTLSPTTAVGPNVDIAGEAAPDRQKAETTVAIDPRNPSIIVVGAQNYDLQCCPGSLLNPPHRWDGYYRSTDDGRTWTSSLLPGYPGDTSPQGLGSPLQNYNLATDPVLAFDRAGNAYYAGIALSISPSGTIQASTAFVAKYVNDGANYTSTTLISGDDKPWIAVDTSGGPNDGNVYLIYQSRSSSVFARSTDGGKTFSSPILVPTLPGGAYATGISVDPSGTVYVASYAFDSNLITAKIFISKSTNGGLSLSTPVVAASGLTPTLGSDPLGNRFRVETLPQIASDSSGVYIVADDNSTGTMNVLFFRSIDGGTIWSVPLMINDVTTGQHFDPTIAVSGGIISVAWYDSRLAVNLNGTMTALDVFYAKSADAGTTFSKNVRVTSVSFNPNIVNFSDYNRNGAFIGDYNQIAATPAEAHAVWSDTRTACDTIDPKLGCIDQDAFTATISGQLTVAINRSATLDSSRVTTAGNLTVDGATLTVSGPLTVSAFDAVSGALTFAKTYAIAGLILRQASSSSPLIAETVLNVAVLPYALSSDVTVQLQAGTVTAGGLLSREFDINADGTVNIIDVSIAAASYGTILGTPKYNPQADFNADGTINIIDLAMIASYYNTPAFR